MAGSITISHSHPNCGLSLDAKPDFRHSHLFLSVDKSFSLVYCALFLMKTYQSFQAMIWLTIKTEFFS